jgi:outer membrane cobalamin receptor
MHTESVDPSFRDSGLVDLVLTVTRHGQAFQLIRKDVEVKIDANNIPSATADFALGLVDELDTVPTVDMTEKGGKRQMSHSYH